MKKSMLYVGLSLTLTACATGYQMQSFSFGFDESQLAPNVWKVGFKGNAATSKTRAEELTLLRSADLTMQNGFNYFVLASSNTDVTYSSYTAPANSTTTFNANSYGGSTYGTARTNTTGGQTSTVAMPSSSNTVVMHKEKPEVQGMVFDAKFICDSLGRKYETRCGTLR